MTYQANGNINWKKDVGHYCYHASRKNAVTGTHTDGNSCGTAWQYDDWGNMLSDDSRTIVYSDFDKPTSITSTGTHTETTQFAYDTGRSRYERISHALNDDGVMEETRTLYFGAQERVYERNDNNQWTLKETVTVRSSHL